MKIPQNASKAFKRKKPDAKVLFGQTVIDSISANPKQFPNLPISTDELQAANDALKDGIVAANSGNHSAVDALPGLIEAWDEAFEKTATYVSGVANGDASLIRLAGFVPTKGETSPAQLPIGPVDYSATINGKKGAIIANSKNSIPGAKAYAVCAVPTGVDVVFNDNVVEITVDGKTIYFAVDTRKKIEIYDLPSGVSYDISMYAVNTAGSGPAATQTVIPQ